MRCLWHSNAINNENGGGKKQNYTIARAVKNIAVLN